MKAVTGVEEAGFRSEVCKDGRLNTTLEYYNLAMWFISLEASSECCGQ